MNKKKQRKKHGEKCTKVAKTIFKKKYLLNVLRKKKLPC
jgi:hypothetical protein